MGKATEIALVAPDEVELLGDISRQTFTETFATSNDPAEFSSYLESAFAIPKLTAEMHTEGSDFFLARLDGEVAGYLKLNTGAAQTEQVEGNTLEIERIYVLQRCQGTGIGKALFDFAVATARDAGHDAIWLGVWEENPKAIRFYERQGFEPFGDHVFVLGSEAQRDIMMRLDLTR